MGAWVPWKSLTSSSLPATLPEFNFPIHPLYQKKRWKEPYQEIGKISDGNGRVVGVDLGFGKGKGRDGMPLRWDVDEDGVWAVLEPVVKLASCMLVHTLGGVW
jgi:hypothetical protein